MDIKLDEVEYFGIVSTVLGIVIFIVTCYWDYLLGSAVNHSIGYGWMQSLIMAVSGLYSCWALTIAIKWKNYIGKIHNFLEE